MIIADLVYHPLSCRDSPSAAKTSASSLPLTEVLVRFWTTEIWR